MNKENNPYLQAYQREKKARLKAEHLLEEKSRQLFQKEIKLRESYVTLRERETAMLKTEKLATLGTLSAGIAHEINNPLAFVLSNMETLVTYTQSYQHLFKLTQAMLLDGQFNPQASKAISQLIEQEDLTYVSDDIVGLLEDTGDGLLRVRDIVDNLSSFSRTQSSDMIDSDLLTGIKGTLKLIDSELKGAVDLQLALEPLPNTLCNPNELNQVFLNLIINAKHATKDVLNPTIKITCHSEDDTIIIRVQDNGCGMSKEVKKQIFVPFFTTKPVGQGTGMGMAVAYGIVTDHQGDILVESKEGEGSVFEVRLPIVSSL